MQPGTRLGHYEILSAIGKGGMGEVWKAHDTKLNRDVAIKTLPPELAEDTERLTRFEREAQLLASLNHVNIAAIYGLEDRGSSRFLVLELVEGDTLADRVKEPMPVDDAIDVATQIARALEAAHGQGVIHRDLKPENIKLRPDGVVKVLDFGLAKLAEPAGMSEAPAQAIHMTKAGAILGTAAYMSPEQARGALVDKRTDIWAFGAVLYEMLTGQMAFRGRDTTEIMASVIKSDPDWSAIPETVPPLVVAFLKACLVKDPAQRVHDIADVRLALTGIYALPRSATNAESAARSSGFRHRSAWLAAAAALVALAVVLAMYRPPSGEPMSVRQLTTRHGSVGTARFAPDGQVIVYGAAWDTEPYRLYETRLDGGQSRPIDLAAADLLDISDSNRLAISLSRQPVAGWQPHGIYAEVDPGGSPRARHDNVVAVELGPDGEPVAMVRWIDGRSQLEYPIGVVIHEDGVIGAPRLSPGGERICFHTGYGSLMSAVRGGPVQVIAAPVPRVNSCAWSPDGEEIWFTYSVASQTHNNIEAVSLNGERRVLAAFTSFMRIQDVSSEGHVLLAAGSLRFSAHGSPAPDQEERDLSVYNATQIIQLGHDGSQLLVFDDSVRLDDGSQGDGVFTRLIDGTPPTQYGTGRPLAITSDGDFIAMLGDGIETGAIESSSITLLPTGIGDAHTIRLPIRTRFPDRSPIGINAWELQHWEFSDDGRRLLIPFGSEDGAEPRVWVYDIEEEELFAITREGVTGPVILSADGRRVASSEPEGLYLYAVDGGDRREVPGGRDAGKLVRWSSDPNVVYLMEQHGAGATVYARNIVTGESRVVREVHVPDPAGVTRFDLWVSRDGEAYAYALDRWLTNLFVIENLR